jgi:DNA-directed RNA polymerase subunit RPC12/RpoP
MHDEAVFGPLCYSVVKRGHMKIPVTCARCGKRYEVDATFAGKRGKCATCGERMTIPDEDQATSAPPAEPDSYQLDDARDSEQSTSFAPAQGSDGLEEPQPRRRVKKKNPRSSGRNGSDRARSHPALSTRATLIGLACAVVVLVSIAIFVPGARLNVGRAIALAGLILFFYGYGSGAYIAFTEDDLYGWLYLFFPPYAAYYYISRWEEMSSRLVMLILGLALLAGGGRLLEMERPPPAAENGATA